ncbi:MAG: hypothetical protein ABSC08_14790 [Bryobacteraceae bacterium]|jgi:hypothetical protein
MTTRQSSTSWDLAGIRPERPIGGSTVWAPAPLDCRDGNLSYRVGQAQRRPVDQSLLSGFLRLAEASDDAVLRFSKKWGILGLCKHGLPWKHSDACIRTIPSFPGHLWAEKTEHWRTLAAAFKCLINISAELSQGRTGAIDDWRFVERRLSGPDFPAWDAHELHNTLSGENMSRMMLMTLVRRLIWIADVTVQLGWNWASRTWEISFDSNGVNLLALLTLQLLLTMTKKGGFAICRSCHQSYIPRRKPDPTRRNYCRKCGIKAAWRDAARDGRERRRRMAEQE